MEPWKLASLIGNFIDDCENGQSQAMIDSMKKLRGAYKHLRRIPQQIDVLEQMFPLLDHPKKLVRQCAASVILGQPLERFATMPEQIIVVLKNNAGSLCFQHEWRNTYPEQPLGWTGSREDGPDSRSQGFGR